MPQFAPVTMVQLAFFVTLAVWTILVAWTFFGSRKRLARQVPFERRRPVPWGGVEVVVLIGVFMLSPLLVAVAARDLLHLPKPAAVEESEAGTDAEGPSPENGKAHPVEQLLRENHSVWALMVSGLMAVLMAPIIEEFMFRVVFQGWLEKVETRYRRRFAGLRALPGAAPILLSSLFFAAMHIRPPESEIPVDRLLFLLGCQAVASLFTLPLAILTLRLGSGATWADMGFVPSFFRRDVTVGLAACLAVVGPIYLLFLTVQSILPKEVVADPIALIPLAMALGALYYRTHRIMPSIVLHMAFNLAGLAALFTFSVR